MVNRRTRFSSEESREIFLDRIEKGWTFPQIAEYLDLTVQALEYYLKNPEFKARYRQAQAIRDANRSPSRIKPEDVPDFPEFCSRYLGMELYHHQLQWYDLLEAAPSPRDLHPSQTFVSGDENMIIINTPPFHAKTTTVSINYVTWRIVQDPNIHVALISKTQSRAKEILQAVSERLSGKNRLFAELKDDFAPRGGYDGGGTPWTASQFYLNPSIRDSGDKDPTCQARGITQQIYGARIDLMILDDVLELSNAHEFEKQIAWIQSIAQNRMDLTTTGQIVLIGTRMAQQDLYSEIQRPQYYAEGESPWTYLTQPAVLEMAEDPEQWKTLWPASNRPLMASSARKNVKGGVKNDDGTFSAWPGWKLAKVKKGCSAEQWARIYMQQQVSDSMTFQPKDLDGCTNGLRVPGPIVAGSRGHREAGMRGLHVIAGVDPATEGYTAAVCLGVDIQTGRRYVLDVFNKKQCLPHELNALIKAWTGLYGVREWRIETVGYQQSIIQDLDLQQFCRNKGVQLRPHITGRNKWDETYGVASMSQLFKGHETGIPLIELPNRKGHFGVQSLFDQLVSWYPTPSRSVRAPLQDCVMALWFAELLARELVSPESGLGAIQFIQDDLISPQEYAEQWGMLDWSDSDADEEPLWESPLLGQAKRTRTWGSL